MKALLKKSLALPLLILVAVITTSCGGDGSSTSNVSIPGVDGPKVTLNQDDVLIAMVMENVHLEGGLRYRIPKYPNSYVEVSPDLQSNGTLLAFSISLDDVFGINASELDALTLPGGRALPGIATGSLPAVAFTIEQFANMSVYLGPKVFGIFVPVKLGIEGAIVTSRFHTGSSRIGNLSVVGEDANGENSGILLMLDMGRSTTKRLKRVAKRF